MAHPGHQADRQTDGLKGILLGTKVQHWARDPPVLWLSENQAGTMTSVMTLGQEEIWGHRWGNLLVAVWSVAGQGGPKETGR